MIHKRMESIDVLVSEGKCPKCGGELDTGWECNSCDFDARPIALGWPSQEDPRPAFCQICEKHHEPECEGLR